MQEQWKPVVGYEGLYEVSSFGRVKSLPRNGTKNQDVIMSPSDNNYGYNKITLKNKSAKTKYVHVLVAEAFLNYKAEKGVICVDHINSNKKDNNLNNLRVISQRENLSRSKKSNTNNTGVYKVGDKFRALIYINKKSKHLGYFDTIENAKNAYELELNNLQNEK
jgi:hypothetical protein